MAKVSSHNQNNRNNYGNRNDQNQTPMEVISNYNFVPAPEEKEVFVAHWADQISHDIPFEDGESGEIEIEIEAKTPIFIRNGHAQGEETSEFSHIKIDNVNKYFIPATSLKGMIRNNLEIMSYSKLNKKLVNDHRYSHRDISKSDTPYMKEYGKEKVLGGWLKQVENENWEIEECEELAYINHKELKLKDIPFRDYFLDKNPTNKSASYKYDEMNRIKKGVKYGFKTKVFGNVTRNIAFFDDNGKEGTLVFTGQPGKRTEFTKEQKEKDKKKDSGKINEFVFFDRKNPTIHSVRNKKAPETKASDFTKDDFLFIYMDHDRNNVSKDWKFWREKLKKGEKVPVFFQKDSNGRLLHFGLSFMYKLPYKYSIHQLLPNINSKDLTDVMFGHTTKEDSLKGRLLFSSAICTNDAPKVLSLQKEILGGPKASYFPFYLNQDDRKQYKTYDDQDAILKGFKKYPIHLNEKTISYSEKQKLNDKVFSKFSPLSSGTKFKFKVRYFNLKPIEIGALLSALTFHGNHDKLFHSLGGAKPLGYGKVKFNVTLNDNHIEKMRVFEDKLNEHCQKNVMNKKWIETDQIKELFAMASEPNDTANATLRYPELAKPNVPARDANEFVNIKKDNGKLDAYSTKNTFIPSELKTNDELQSLINNFYFDNQEIKTLGALQTKMIEAGFGENEVQEKDKLKNKIFSIIQNDKESRKKFKKPYDDYFAKTPFSKWLGMEESKNFHNEMMSTFN